MIVQHQLCRNQVEHELGILVERFTVQISTAKQHAIPGDGNGILSHRFDFNCCTHCLPPNA